MNRYPIWKYLIVVLVLVLGGIYSSPNLFPPDPAVQVTPVDGRFVLSPQTSADAKAALSNQDIEFFGEELNEKNLLLRLTKDDDQLNAKAAIQEALGDDFVVALNQADTTPSWLAGLGGRPMALGLDLRGGVHFLLEVDMDTYIRDQLENYVSDIQRQFRDEKIRYRSVRKTGELELQLAFRDQENLELAETYLRRNLGEFLREDIGGERPTLKLTLTEERIGEMEDYAIRQNLTTLSNRVNELGVAEPIVQRQGRNRIVVELPGVQDTAQAKKILGKSANLEFRLQASGAGGENFRFRNPADGRGTARLERDIIVTGDNVTNARVSYDESGMPQVAVDLNSAGGARMGQVTKRSIGVPMGVLFIEQKTKTTYVVEDGKRVPKYSNETEKSIISLATIRGAFSSSFVITGLEGGEAADLALLLRAGALAAPMYIINERTIGPSLGAENIQMGLESVTIGFIAVIIVMLALYRTFGLFANVALALNLGLLIAVLSMLQATLTLPGIAGIVLTVGMAVDANVLIFSRIREELNNGLAPQSAIHSGYERAFVTILDANITTLIVAIILYAVGTGPIKGFAVTLSIGILTSMFTAIMVTRSFVNLVYGGRSLKSLGIWEIWKWKS